MKSVLVINADLGPLHRVSLRHALRMLYRQVAVVHESDGSSRIGPWLRPTVVRLVSYVVTRWRWRKSPAWSRSGVLNRDGRTCAYCQDHATTVDHILPVSRGGKNTWDNTTAACGSCNNIKGSRTPDEAGMPLTITPYIPAWATARPGP